MAASATYLGIDHLTANQSTYTFSSVGLSASLPVVVIVHARCTGTSSTLDSVTINGVSATLTGRIVYADSANRTVTAIVEASPGAATGDVVVTFSGAMLRCSISRYTMSDGGTVAVLNSDTTDPATLDGTVPDDSSVIAGYSAGSSSSGFSDVTTWTGLTEDNDTSNEFMAISAAHQEFATGGSKSISVTNTEGSSDQSSLAVVYSPSGGGPTIVPGGLQALGRGFSGHYMGRTGGALE